MNLLFDFISLGVKTGAGEYVRRVFYELMERLRTTNHNVKVFALYNSAVPVAYKDMTKDVLDIPFLDVSQKTIRQIVAENGIDRFFIGCAQHIGVYPELDKIDCEVICVTHDLCFEEFYYNRITPLFYLNMKDAEKPAELKMTERLKMRLFPKTHYDQFVKWYLTIGGIKGIGKNLFMMDNIMKLYNNNPKFHFVVVSDYTKNSVIYHLGVPAERILVLYSPERLLPNSDIIDNHELADVVSEQKKFFLMVSCQRKGKNPTKALNALKVYCRHHPDFYAVTIGYGKRLFEHHIDLPFLSDSDLTNAYIHCYALLYPSFFEGFGYPPIEAMHYGKPVLCSNVTSMPGIYGDAPIYFSPMYESDIYSALNSLTEKNYSVFSEKSRTQYNIIKERQDTDLQLLLNMLV